MQPLACSARARAPPPLPPRRFRPARRLVLPHFKVDSFVCVSQGREGRGLPRRLVRRRPLVRARARPGALRVSPRRREAVAFSLLPRARVRDKTRKEASRGKREEGADLELERAKARGEERKRERACEAFCAGPFVRGLLCGEFGVVECGRHRFL